MKRFTHSFNVDCPIERVWEFYTNINHLKVITPQEMRLEIISTSDELIHEGSECWIEANLVTPSKWHSKITFFKPPSEYVDEMQSGRFKIWRHLHRFSMLSDGKTEIFDQIDFELPYGFLGAMFENYVVRKLDEVFKHREKSTIGALQQGSQISLACLLQLAYDVKITARIKLFCKTLVNVNQVHRMESCV